MHARMICVLLCVHSNYVHVHVWVPPLDIQTAVRHDLCSLCAAASGNRPGWVECAMERVYVCRGVGKGEERERERERSQGCI